MKSSNVIGFVLATLLFFIASFIDGEFNELFFSIAILLVILSLFYFYKSKNEF
ncbi:hypothetical protein PNC201_20865 (plasmid) [Pseudoalteromonas sp. NC201]|nr:hypothetical protein PNC201_20865 [Pseudoalteromonas sp. NC201]